MIYPRYWASSHLFRLFRLCQPFLPRQCKFFVDTSSAMDRPASAKLRSLEDGREVCTIAAGLKGQVVRHGWWGVGDADAWIPWNQVSLRQFWSHFVEQFRRQFLYVGYGRSPFLGWRPSEWWDVLIMAMVRQLCSNMLNVYQCLALL